MSTVVTGERGRHSAATCQLQQQKRTTHRPQPSEPVPCASRIHHEETSGFNSYMLSVSASMQRVQNVRKCLLFASGRNMHSRQNIHGHRSGNSLGHNLFRLITTIKAKACSMETFFQGISSNFSSATPEKGRHMNICCNVLWNARVSEGVVPDSGQDNRHGALARNLMLIACCARPDPTAMLQ
eukprot:2021628-Pleurochrysis_carterae.AAC.1